MSLVIIFLIILFIPLADSLVKINIINNFTSLTQINTFLPFLKFVKVENPGIAFGALKNQNLFVLIVSFIVIIALVGFIILKKPKDKLILLGISFIIGGGIGNLCDRFKIGYVVDYIKLTFFPPVFNLSDCFICMGVLIIIVKNLKALRS